MSKQRSSQSTSGRSSQSSASRATATTTQNEAQGGGLGVGQPGAQSGSVVEQTKEKAQELAGQVQQKATQRVESGLTRGKVQAAETLNTVAQSLIISGQQLRERKQEGIGRFVDQTADRVQRVSNYLQNTDVSEMVDRTEGFARRRPALFLGGAFALGLLGARFLKSSRRQQEKQTTGVGLSGAGTRSGQGYSRERSVGVDQEIPTPRQQEEWAAGGAEVSGLADVASTRPQTQPLSESGFGRQKGSLDLGLPPGGPEAAQR
jgi:hypothetical protein